MSVWPQTAQRVGGALAIGGVDVRDIATEFDTPAYVLDEADFRARCRRFRDALTSAAGGGAAGSAGSTTADTADVYYAGKAFLCRAVARWVAEEGLALDVCTGGELAVALAAGFPPERIAFHGNNKSQQELDRALAAGVGRFVVDSFQEIARLAFLADRHGTRARVHVRVATGVEADTHEYIATAHDDQKFGFGLDSGAAAEAVRHVRALTSLELAGLHSHVGSQIVDTADFEMAARRTVGLLQQVHNEHGDQLPELNLGGGFGIAYVPDDEALDVQELAETLRATVSKECAAAGLRVPRLGVEPGRAIVGPAGITVYEVGTVKDSDGWWVSRPPPPADRGSGAAVPRGRAYVSVDGGMSDNIRAPLYGATYTCVLASRHAGEASMQARLVGKHCENGDVVIPDLRLPADLAPGDLLAVAATGAYCRALASNYNHVPRPPVIAAAGGQARAIVRRETEDDLLRLDVD